MSQSCLTMGMAAAGEWLSFTVSEKRADNHQLFALSLIQIQFSKSFQVQLQAAAVFRIWGIILLQHTALTQPNHNHILKRNSINATWHISPQIRFQLQIVDCLLYAAC